MAPKATKVIQTMKLTGLNFVSIRRLDSGLFWIGARYGELSDREAHYIKTTQSRTVSRDLMELLREDSMDFFIIRSSVAELRKRYGDPTFLIQSLSFTPPESGIGYNALHQESLVEFPAVEMTVHFYVNEFGDFVASPRPRSVIVQPPFEAANELIAATISPWYRFNPVILFTANAVSLSDIVQGLSQATELAEFRRLLLEAFPVLFRVNHTEGYIALLTTDSGLVEEVTTLSGLLPET